MSDGGDLTRVTSERDLAVERFVLMCKAMKQCMWDWDMRANVAWYSDTIYEVYGIDPTVTPSFERWTTYVHPEDRERVVAGFRNVVESGKSEWADEYRFVRPNDGKVLDVFDRGFVKFDEGRPVRIVGVVMDITKQRALERQLQHAQKMQAIGQLAGGIAHDFNNMLQAAKLETEMLLRATPGTSVQVHQHAKEVAIVLDRAASLTRQLLMFSRLEAMRLEVIDLNAKITELTTMLRRLLGDDLALGLELTSDVVAVEADSSMLDQILVNLVVNARDAMARGGTLAIATRRCGQLEPAARPPGRYVCLEVRDTGAGIPTEIMPRIFDPFFTTKANGTGLGLATVYGIVEQHRGWIDVDSELGRGTTVRVYLPQDERESTPKQRAVQTPTPRGRETILLVEDDGPVLRALSSVLESEGYDVVTADSGAAALAAWETAGRIDLVVTDLMMPGMNGRELATELLSRRKELAILIISGQSRDLAPGSARYEFLHKPFAGETLLAAVRGCLDRAREISSAAPAVCI
jgi:PAS domain S-box-containing protein